MRYWCGGSPVDLSHGDFVAQGGEGRVYAKGAMAYKIYHEGIPVLPESKLQELSVLRGQGILRPLEMVTDGTGAHAGHSMRFVRDALPLCRLFAPSFRAKNRVSEKQVWKLVQRLRYGLEEIHAAGVIVADLNETNLLVSDGFQDLFFSDVASWQTRHLPATAVMVYRRQAVERRWTRRCRKLVEE